MKRFFRIKWGFMATLVFMLLSCHKETKKWDDLEPVVIDHNLTLRLDSLSTPIAVYPQIIKGKGGDFLSTINVIDNSIKFYDLSSGNLINTVYFDSDGPNGLSDLLSFHYISKDSLLYLDQVGRLYLLDSSSQILSQWKAKDVNEKGLPLFYDNILPVTGDFQENIIIPNYYTSQLDRKLFFSLNMLDSQFFYKVSPPAEFIEGFFGFGDFGEWNFVRNQKGFYLNFPNIKEVFHYDNNLEFVDKIALETNGSLPDFINPFPYDFDLKLDPIIKKEVLLEKLNQNYVFGRLLFDESSKRFLRFLKFPIPENSQFGDERKYSLIIYDENWNFVKENRIPINEYHLKGDSFFINNGYLYLQKNIENEDLMIFDAISLF